MQDKSEETGIRRMANLLRQGATLTELSCPSCSAPLFRLKNGTLWCGKCEKKVLVVRDEDADKLTSTMALEKLETTLLGKVQKIQDKIQDTENIEELQKLSSTLSELLNNLDKVKKIKTV